MRRPSPSLVMVMESGLARKAFENFSSLAASAALGIVAGQLHRNGSFDAAHGTAIAMEVATYTSLGSSVIDLLLFGGHDNATIIGYKLAF